MRRRVVAYAAFAAFAIVLAWILFVALPRRYAAKPAAGPAAAQAVAPATPQRKITATLYFISQDGLSLVGTQREVPFGEPAAKRSWI
jgi:hypothetical protein